MPLIPLDVRPREFGAEPSCYHLRYASPLPRVAALQPISPMLTAEYQRVGPPPRIVPHDPRVPSPVLASRAVYLPGYNYTILSKTLAKRFRAQKNHYIAVWMRDVLNHTQHGVYTRVHDIVDDDQHGPLFMIVSAEDINVECALNAAPPPALVVRQNRGGCQNFVTGALVPVPPPIVGVGP